MSWQKLGKLYECGGLHPKLQSHAANPLPMHLERDTYHIFFSARDNQNRSSVGAVDIDIVQQRVIREYNKPIFEFGNGDSFYSHGVSIGNIYKVDNQAYMLFMGWKNPPGKHWYGEIGRLLVKADLSLELESETPFLGLDDTDPISLSYPWVMKLNDRYLMWYGSTIEWDAGNGEMLHIIKYAESKDGHSWIKQNYPIPYALGWAQAFSKPTVVQNSMGEFTMWFSYRSGDGSKYKIGSAKSYDCRKWDMSLENNTIMLSNSGWDSQMIEYPFVFQHNDNIFMLYNGNQFGKSGFGLAVWKD